MSWESEGPSPGELNFRYYKRVGEHDYRCGLFCSEGPKTHLNLIFLVSNVVPRELEARRTGNHEARQTGDLEAPCPRLLAVPGDNI